MKARRGQSELTALDFGRPAEGLSWLPDAPNVDLPARGLPAWRSNGGPTRGHPARSLPFSFDARLHKTEQAFIRLHFLGIFAMFASNADETSGTLGASIHVMGDRDVLARQDLVNGRHYHDARNSERILKVNGDGSSIETVGTCTVDGAEYRVDLLSVDLPATSVARSIHFKDLGSPASFVIFDIFAESEESRACPFKASSGGVSLAELGAAIRVGDRLKFSRSLDQLEIALVDAEDLDEARGQALTFLAVITASSIEAGGNRLLHKAQLEAARELEGLTSPVEMYQATRDRVLRITENLFASSESPSDRLVDRALAIVERHFAKELTDAMVAAQLGLSTSHFRFLFKQATGQPFHKYVVALRLEKARKMLIEQEIPVSQVATAVGFAGLSHFSRAFTQRFAVSPSSIRRSLG